VFISLLVGISVFCTAHISVMTGARYLFAAGRAGEIPRILGTVSRFNTPLVALLAQVTWAVILLSIPWQLGDLLGYFGVATWIYYALVAAAQLRLRRTHRDSIRPFRVPFYSAPSVVVIVIGLYLVVASFVKNPIPSAAAVGFLCLSFPARFVWLKFAAAGVKNHDHDDDQGTTPSDTIPLYRHDAFGSASDDLGASSPNIQKDV